MVLVHDTLPRRGLQVYQVSLKIFNGFQVIELTRFVTDRQTERRTDRQTDARGKTICLPTLKGGERHNKHAKYNMRICCTAGTAISWNVVGRQPQA